MKKNDDHEGVEDDEDEAEKKKEEEEMEEEEAEQDKVDAKDKKGNSKERKEVVEKRVETEEERRERRAPRIEQRLQVGETVSVVCGSGRVSPWMKSNVFKAKIVHFVGWNRRHDKWITVEELYEARIRPVPLRWLIKRYGPTGRRPREPEEEEQQEEDEEFADENIQA
ncbi:hypothetical protein TYRP_009673 [Tyrophagus putrescentiae]|nr:hypothetical protein TYRP_009673 [Tyrophagus putrescentiae]